MLCGFSSFWWPFGWNWSYLGFLGIIWRTCGSKCQGEGGGIFPTLCVECCLVFNSLQLHIQSFLPNLFIRWKHGMVCLFRLVHLHLWSGSNSVQMAVRDLTCFKEYALLPLRYLKTFSLWHTYCSLAVVIVCRNIFELLLTTLQLVHRGLSALINSTSKAIHMEHFCIHHIICRFST